MKVIFIKKRVMYLLIILIIVLIFLTFIPFFINKSKETFKEENDIFYKGNINKKTIAFTCNVDWGNKYIPPMIEIFRKNNIKITFFTTGTWANNNSQLLKQIYDAGHEIGNHGYYHKNYGNLNYISNKNQIQMAHEIIKNIIGESPKYFAPPAGSFNKYTIRAAKDLNYKVIMWSIDTIDWRKDTTEEKIYNRVINNLNNSAIVLMHPKKNTINVLPKMIKSIKKKNYKIGKVSDIIR